MSVMQVIPSRLRALAGEAATVAGTIAAIAPTGAPPGEEMGSEALAESTEEFLDSWMVATWAEAEQWGQIGEFLVTTADRWEALDAALAGVLAGSR